MTVWNHPVSWSKFKCALACPKQLKYTIDKTQPSYVPDNYYMVLGKAAQFVFEMYFNQKVNLKPNGRSKGVILKAVQKIRASTWLDKQEITYPKGTDPGTFWTEVERNVLRGYELFDQLQMLEVPIQSEVKWGATFRNFRMFAMIDFVHRTKDGVFIYDGKGNKQKDADPRQLLYYGLVVSASDTLLGGGFLYWQHDYQPVDLSPAALKTFADGEFAKGVEIFRPLRSGTEDLQPTPGDACFLCYWKRICTASPFLNPERQNFSEGEVDLSLEV